MEEKIRDRLMMTLHGWGALAATVFLATLAAIAGVAMWQRYRTELKPRREELKRMLDELGG